MQKKTIKYFIVTVFVFIMTTLAIQYIIFPYYEAISIESRIKKNNPLLEVIENYYPNDYANIKKELRNYAFLDNNKKNKDNFLKIEAKILQIINNLMLQSFWVAPPKDVYLFFKLRYQLVEKVYKMHPELAPTLINNSFSTNALLSSKLTENERNQLQVDISKFSQALITLINHSIKTPTKMTTDERDEAAQNIMVISVNVIEKFGQDAFKDALTPSTAQPINQKRTFEIINHMMGLILLLEEEKSGQVLKLLFAEQ